MRWLTIILLACCGLAVGTPAFAKPSVAIAPIDGDDNDKVGNAIAEALADDADATGPTPTGKAMAKLNLSGELTNKDKKALFKKLNVEAIVEGKLEKDGKKRSLKVKVTAKGEKSAKFTVEFKKETSDAFKTEVRDGILKRIGGGDDGEKAEKAEKPDKADKQDNDKAEKADKKDKEKADKRKDDDEDEDKAKKDKDEDKEVAEGDEDGGSVKKKKKKSDDDETDDTEETDDGDETPVRKRHMVTQVALRANLGAGFGRRSLSYAASGTNIPPKVGTAAASARLEAELYPLATEKLGGAAGLGIYGHYDKSIGLGIAVPGGGTAAIDQAHFAIGARYRATFGQHSFAFGAAYAKRKYMVDRGGAGAMLDVPDVNYSALAPGFVFRIGVAPKIGLSVGADFLLMLDAGAITSKTMYGSGSILAFGADGGIDIALTKSLALRFAFEFAQETIKFNGKGAMSSRGVTAAQDRTIGGAATFAVTY